MSLRARLRIILMADEVVVAESEDPRLWHATLRAVSDEGGEGERHTFSGPRDGEREAERLAVAAFAEELGVDPEAVQAACAPKAIAPYVFLDRHHFESFKRLTPERGRNAVSNIVLALTLLLLWADKMRLARVAVRDGTAVLRTIGARDDHPGRAVDNCPWIRRSMNRLVLVPEEISKAIAVARAYCTKTSPDWGGPSD